MQALGLIIVILTLLAPRTCLGQVGKIPVAVSHSGTDAIGISLAQRVEEAIRTSQRFSLVAKNTPRPRIIINLDSMEALSVAQLQGRASAIGISLIYYRRGLPGVGVFLGTGVSTCSPENIQSCVNTIFPLIEQAADFLKRHDPDLWATLLIEAP